MLIRQAFEICNDPRAIFWEEGLHYTRRLRSGDWNDLNSELTLQVHWRNNPFDSGVFLDSRIHFINTDGDFRFNRSVSTGWNFHRSAGEFRILVNNEYLHDSGVPAVPEEVHLVRVGIRTNSPFVIW